MGAMASQITSLTIVYSNVYAGADQRKHQSSASLVFVRGIQRSPEKWPVTRKCFHLMTSSCYQSCYFLQPVLILMKISVSSTWLSNMYSERSMNTMLGKLRVLVSKRWLHEIQIRRYYTEYRETQPRICLYSLHLCQIIFSISLLMDWYLICV